MHLQFETKADTLKEILGVSKDEALNTLREYNGDANAAFFALSADKSKSNNCQDEHFCSWVLIIPIKTCT